MKVKLSAQFNWPYLILLLGILSGCALFSGETTPTSAKGKVYRIHFASTSWKPKSDQKADYVWGHQDGRVMLANSFCHEFQSEPLQDLAVKTARSVDEMQVLTSSIENFRSREAFKLQATGKVDGVKVGITLLNTRRDNCYFDFVAITPHGAKESGKDFEAFLESVEFL